MWAQVLGKVFWRKVGLCGLISPLIPPEVPRVPVWCRPARESGAQHWATPAFNPTNRKLFVSEHRIRLRPRYLKNVANVDTRTTIQGEEITAPICIAPTGFHCLVWPDGEMSTARGMKQPHPEAPFQWVGTRSMQVSFRAVAGFLIEGVQGHQSGQI